MLALLGAFFLLFGLFFCVMGVIGNIRLPDIFSRLHATSKVSMMGMLGLMVASALLVPASAPKALVLGMLILFSAPVASQAIARSAYRDGCAMVGLLQDDLAVQTIDFPYNYTIGEEIPWQNEVDDVATPAGFEAASTQASNTQVPDAGRELTDGAEDESNT